VSARLSTEIENLKKEVVSNQETLESAIALRQKQLAEFNGEEKELLESVQALGAAITVLEKHHTTGLLQLHGAHLTTVTSALKQAMGKHAFLLKGVLTPRQEQVISFLVANRGGYAPQSGEIFGILKQMKENFEANLSDAQKEELNNRNAFEGLQTAKQEMITLGQKQINDKSNEFAANNEALAKEKTEIDETKAALSADEKFLVDLKERCSLTDKEWETRQKTRQEEMAAVSKALEILTSDDARDTFSKTFEPSLLQTGASDLSAARSEAFTLLNQAALKSDHPHRAQLSALATSVKIDAFTRVKEAIDTMVAQLLQEKEDDRKHKDFCITEFHTNDLETQENEHNQQATSAKLNQEEEVITDSQGEVTSLTEQISQLKAALEQAGANRQTENSLFQQTIADQAKAKELLVAARDALSSNSSALVQRNPEHGPPGGFDTYKKVPGGAAAALTQIISMVDRMTAELRREENSAQTSYEKFVQDTNKAVELKTASLNTQKQVLATAEVSKVNLGEQLENEQIGGGQLQTAAGDLQTSCGFVLKNFDTRSEAFDNEIEALRQAKAVLSGAQLTS
jgi:DNA repair exonuclease SbcCD ATPase subunit